MKFIKIKIKNLNKYFNNIKIKSLRKITIPGDIPGDQKITHNNDLLITNILYPIATT